ncbi:MAG: NUDIX domain-containing protein [Pseudonocardia sp.]|nr:NUDIX domain-containing protein [Pseudonocardia sp.]
MTWLDGSGRHLHDYPRPSVAVDVALLTVRKGRLEVLVHERETDDETGRLSLPGTFVHVRERLADAALRALQDKVGVHGERPEQLGVFDDPDRDDRGRVLSVAHVDLVPLDRLGVTRTLVPAHDPGDLAFDHAAIVRRAVRWARELYRDRPDPRGLAGDAFTLFELQRVHEAVLGERLQKDTFRRRMLGGLRETGASSSGSVGKPARLFTHDAPADRAQA